MTIVREHSSVDLPDAYATRAGHRADLMEMLDFEPDTTSFYAEVVAGLRQPVKTLPCKFFYDQRGSQLFDEICELAEYYPTRTELGIMRDRIAEISALLGGHCRLVEYGSGSSIKTHILLDHLTNLAAYVPVDISRSHLLRSARRLACDYPELTIQPVCADYTDFFDLPPLPATCLTPPLLGAGGLHEQSVGPPRTVVYFPGSTIGNFLPDQAREFLAGVVAQCGQHGGLLIGVDLKKDPRILHEAYNDASGVTAAFNLNVLRRINRELDGDFDTDAFAHYAFYNPVIGRIEMHLVSMASQTARIGDELFRFREGETIHTECSYKYSLHEFADLARSAGFAVRGVWTDSEDLFSVQYLTVEE